MAEKVDSVLQSAAEHLAAGRLQQATNLLEPLIAASMAVKQTGAEASARFLMAQVRVAQGDREGAIDHVEHALKIAEELGEAEILAHFQEFRQWLEAPTGPEATLATAAGFLQTGRPSEAEALITSVLSSVEPNSPDEASARFLLAQASVAQGEREQAKEHIERALKIAERRNDTVALEHFKRFRAGLEKSGPEDIFARVIRLLHQEDAEEAIPILVAELPKIPVGSAAEASACSLLSQALLMKGDPAEGLPFAQRALDIAQEHGEQDVIQHFQELVSDVRAAIS